MALLSRMFARENRTLTPAEIRNLSLTNYRQWVELGTKGA
jgi:hypothetical protein